MALAARSLLLIRAPLTPTASRWLLTVRYGSTAHIGTKNSQYGNKFSKPDLPFLGAGIIFSLLGLFSAKQLLEDDKQNNDTKNEFIKGKISNSIEGGQHKASADQKKQGPSQGEARFRNFASVEVNGELVMTPRDFLEALVQDRPRPRLRSRLMKSEDVQAMTKYTPLISSYVGTHRSKDPRFLRELGDSGIITYSEYLFLLSILTRPKSGLRIAFDIMDLSKGETILKEEFNTFCMVATKMKEDPTSNVGATTTLEAHFFGSSGSHALTFEEFTAFIKGLQREVLLSEFLEFSRGMDRISERDFAEILLRYTDLNEEEHDKYFRMMETRLPDTAEARPGITFRELEQFFVLLNNISDFAYVFREGLALLYSKSGSPLSKKQFARAAKISMNTGEDLSSHLINVIFALFDKAGDNHLSYEEFFVVLKNRLHRQVRRSMKPKGFEAFKQCLKDEIRIQNSQPKSP